MDKKSKSRLFGGRDYSSGRGDWSQAAVLFGGLSSELANKLNTQLGSVSLLQWTRQKERKVAELKYNSLNLKW